MSEPNPTSEPDYGPFGTEARLKHLEMIQAAIARMAANEFQAKAWSAPIVGAMLAFAVDKGHWLVAFVAVVPSIAFWAIDGWFLRAERDFRALYDEVSRPDRYGGAMKMRPFGRRTSKYPWFSPPIAFFHLTFVVGSLATALWLHARPPMRADPLAISCTCMMSPPSAAVPSERAVGTRTMNIVSRVTSPTNATEIVDASRPDSVAQTSGSTR